MPYSRKRVLGQEIPSLPVLEMTWNTGFLVIEERVVFGSTFCGSVVLKVCFLV
jgi:hypothetical protein